ncbi:hypothetical protein Dhaf_2182 [Desulfitobacterium hafniense DCB-2]|uniref:Uncharacterized protein n=1 Tax=Desulfitobacterium hafniense (strain DSM 10664 / DCB-2) TaxID=272564 RepID=B8FSK5_DESHD|nr:hypothetical protein Dhaf_2182 [Desulfitobacterium hafniense DCB-2]
MIKCCTEILLNILNYNLNRISDIRRLRAENAKLVQLVIDQALHIQMLRYIIRK